MTATSPLGYPAGGWQALPTTYRTRARPSHLPTGPGPCCANPVIADDLDCAGISHCGSCGACHGTPDDGGCTITHDPTFGHAPTATGWPHYDEDTAAIA